MKDLDETSYVLSIKILRDLKSRVLALSKESYIDKVLTRFSMQDSKKCNLPFRDGVHLSRDNCPKIDLEIEWMTNVLYASVVVSLMYAMMCTRPDICYVVGVVSRYQ